ncbi:MAG: glutamine--fructose-6-phosphate transaminase (isomerizing) [Chloroflexota bacterium]
MCGIVGYVGERDAAVVVMEGLRRLEYRGYDSAGIAVLDGGKIELRRSVGKLDSLQKVLEARPTSGLVGIGHTRWATHGAPSDHNAHPHSDCHQETVVIHNGIVENYLELKQGLIAEGHKFTSETDTEVIAHLIEKHCEQGLPFEEAVRKALELIRGAHAIVSMSLRDPGKIVAARLGNAGGVVIGVGDNEMFVASDMPAILNYTRNMVFLDNREVAVVTNQGAAYSTLDGQVVEKVPQMVSWDPVSAAKGGYKHFMLKEIHDQPQSATDVIRGRVKFGPPDVYLEGLGFSNRDLRRLNRIIISACGTAMHAGLIGKFLIEELARVPVEVDYASEFRYRDKLLGPDMLLIAVTQSGETVDTLVSMEAAKEHGVKVLGIVNVVGSQASRVADGVIYTHAGPEIGVASTKAFTSQVIALYLWALYLAKARDTIDDERLRSALQDLVELPHLIGETLHRPNPYEELADLYFKRTDFLYLGRGINYPIALEGALKLKEISYIHAEGYPAGEMKHGPIALIDDDMPVVAIAPKDKVYPKMISNIEQVKARRGIVIAVANDGDADIVEKADHILWVPPTSPHLTPVLTVVPLQLLAYHVAVRRGCDVDQPRNLAKSVTVE